ncbi:hypothetical protein CXU19_00595 [Akkermansia muciniphila]|jgi:hypothetical protein|uniref:toll/interleukin-1 receptor domain-containing protein n=1 Tax=Akkermansia sp. TaxID=1872421 RepID=UPI000C9BBB17|nr:hypothetical protein CXU19_00595 [Akkermansia muciniphila]PNC37609.1 hypothetical protein CXU20_12535 [Akkermansia muciniphila]
MNKPVHIFISYCHEDRNFLKGLQDHMIALKRDGSCNAWTDREILAGDTLDKEISGSLDSADIVLLLVSVHFLNSTYCMSREFQEALRRKEETGSPRIIPIITRACDWLSIPELAKLKAPLDGKPIKGFQDMDEAYLGIVKEIRRVIEGQDLLLSGECYSLPEDNDALKFLYDILEEGRPENRKRTGAMYMQRIGGDSSPDMISLSLNPNSGPVYMRSLGSSFPSRQEFCEWGDELHDCGICEAVAIDNDRKWQYYRYRINVDIDLEKLKEKVVQAMQERGLDMGEE